QALAAPAALETEIDAHPARSEQVDSIGARAFADDGLARGVALFLEDRFDGSDIARLESLKNVHLRKRDCGGAGRARRCFPEQLLFAPFEGGVEIGERVRRQRSERHGAIFLPMSAQQPFLPLLQRPAHLLQKRGGALVDLYNALQIQDQIPEAVDGFGDPPEHALDRAEEEASLKLENADRAAAPVENFLLGTAAPALGANGVAAVAAPHDGGFGRAAFEHVQLEALGQLLADADAAPAVALLVEGRGKRADAELPRQNRDDAAADAALGRQADAVAPFAGVIVHAAAVHHAQDVFHVALVEGAPTGERVDAVVGEGRRHHREVAGGDQDRALLEVKIEVVAHRLVDHTGVELEITDGAVAMSGGALGDVNRVIDLQRPAGE